MNKFNSCISIIRQRYINMKQSVIKRTESLQKKMLNAERHVNLGLEALEDREGSFFELEFCGDCLVRYNMQ